MQKPLLIVYEMMRITPPLPALRYLPINFLPLQVQALSLARLLPLCLVGFAFLWILIGGIFFGAVQDFTSLYASVKNDGKSMGKLIEQYVGKTGAKMFLMFGCLFSLLVIAAFSDIMASTFNGFAKDGALMAPNAAAGSISMLYIGVAVIFGIVTRRFHITGAKELVLGLVCIFAMISFGIAHPLFASRTTWLYVTYGYCFLASILPMWLLIQPRDYLSVFLLLGSDPGRRSGHHRRQPLHQYARLHFLGSRQPAPVPHPVYHHRLRRRFRLPQPGILRNLLQDHFQRKGYASCWLRFHAD